MKFKVGDKVLYQDRPYYIKQICGCTACVNRFGEFSVFLLGEQKGDTFPIVNPLNIRPFIALGEQLLFSFMEEEPIKPSRREL